MLRALFILLAVVSFVLAIVLEMPVLYGAAGVLILIAVVMLIVAAKKRHKRSKQSYLATTSGKDHDDELAALGIADIRPRERKRTTGDDDDDVTVIEEPQHRSAEGRTARPESTRDAKPALPEADTASRAGDGDGDAELRALGIMEIKPRERKASSPLFEFSDADDSAGASNGADSERRSTVQPKARIADPNSPEAIANRESMRRELFTPYLQAVQSAVGANTVCLLRHDENALKYHIEAIVSKNAYARSKGHFTSRTPLLTPAVAKRPVLTFRIGEKGLGAANLGYYLEPIAVKQIAVAEVPTGVTEGGTFLLLADTMDEGGLSEARQHVLLSQFARVLGTVLRGGEGEVTEEVRSDYRPRREIIEEEMERARAGGLPLALILVYLNQAEAVASEGEEAVNEAEAILEGKLRELVGERRVEHFGELVYGVFDHGQAAAVESWVVHIQNQLHEAAGPLEGGVSIGIAMMKERHSNADSFRADATSALREAYETGACTLIE